MLHVSEYARVGTTPELRFAGSGEQRRAVTSLRLAFSRTRRNAEGEFESSPPIWMDAEAWGPLAEQLARLVPKGALIHVSGRIEDATWTDKEGRTRPAVKLVLRQASLPLSTLESVSLLRRPDATSGDGADSPPSSESAAEGAPLDLRAEAEAEAEIQGLEARGHG